MNLKALELEEIEKREKYAMSEVENLGWARDLAWEKGHEKGVEEGRMDLKPDYQSELALLGYTQKWLDCGILSGEWLLEQIAIFQSLGADQNTEHYRYATFSNFLRGIKSISDKQVDDYLWLAFDDDDSVMARAAVFDLIKVQALTDKQFDMLQYHKVTKHFKTSRIYLRYQLLRIIRRNGLTPEVIKVCMEKGDGVVHQTMLERELDRKTILLLADKGATKAVRNIAKQRLNSQKYAPSQE